MTGHALCSPSGAHRWLQCPASVFMQQGMPDEGSTFAAEGTAAHEAAALALLTGVPAQDEDVQSYVSFVEALGGDLQIEAPLDISSLTGEPGAKGTVDALVYADGELHVVDLKFGRGVRVDAEHNEQLSLYALAALSAYPEAKSVRLVIHQPRLNHVSEWVTTPEALREWWSRMQPTAARALQVAKDGQPTPSDFGPAEKPCRFCKAKAVCAPLADKVRARPDFKADLSEAMGQVDLVEGWCKAVRAETERRLLAGQPVAGFKLVAGRKGARQWVSTEQAEELLRSMRLPMDDMFTKTLISPTAAEKLHKAGRIKPRQWPRLAECITQKEGAPSVAPESDARPAINPVAADFEVIT